MSDNSSSQDYADIITKEIPLVKDKFTKKQNASLSNPRYLRLLKIIHDFGPLTLNQIVEIYPEKVADDEANSISTIYRSLQFLQDQKLVIEVGTRITEDKLFTKKLFSLTAKFFVKRDEEIYTRKTIAPFVFSNILRILETLYPEQLILEISLSKWMTNFVNLYNEICLEILNSQDPTILKLISVWSSPPPRDLLVDAILLSVLFQNKLLIPQLLECFPTKTGKLPLEEKYPRVKDTTESPFQDYITKIPEVFLILESTSAEYKLISKSPYNYLVHILMGGPFTMNEIIKRFNAMVITPKKSSTIYAYVKKLKEQGIVIDVGRRFVKGRKIPERLHCVAGRWIITEITYNEKIENSYLFNTIKAISEIIKYRHPEIKSINNQKFSLLVKKIFNFSQDINEKYSNPDNLEIRKLVTSQSFAGFFHQFYTTNLILICKELHTLRDELISCFTFHEK
ncbi:MAG: hypothetical protein FK733_03380 [Asgard group archaeon]|nr:hypothetical protein [Asgard group archaeon]